MFGVQALFISALVTAVYQSAFFAIAYFLDTDHVTDFAGTSNIALLALLSLFLAEKSSARHQAVAFAIVLWAVRLGAFLVSRIRGWGRDRRFDDFRKTAPSLAKFWTLQGVWVWVTALSVTLLGAAPYHPAMRLKDTILLIIFLGGLTMEAVADAQKDDARGSAGWPHRGLWSYSRHPNYFGEIVVWWALYGICAPALKGWIHIAVLSPVLVTLLLLFVSGVPILERNAERKYGFNPQFQVYKRRTSLVVPLPPMLYEHLPDIVKKFPLLDFASRMVVKRRVVDPGGHLTDSAHTTSQGKSE